MNPTCAVAPYQSTLSVTGYPRGGAPIEHELASQNINGGRSYPSAKNALKRVEMNDCRRRRRRRRRRNPVFYAIQHKK
ncbi:hypothetical protein OIU85_016718 [Salix viminalis]|uniref:Uncharacterized protein n=1 Tax=Salix viminalis TaxID=40686 RepID=A0A9Q0V7S7_SALVM|nr:hypothetical protein OIU85_016718 [Salix viminalis]